MLIPLGHEKMAARRWPLVTFAIIAINVFAFLGTYSTLEEEASGLFQVKVHLLMLSAMHPELSMADGPAADFVDKFADANPGVWKELANPNRQVEDAWDAQMRLVENPRDLQAEMDSLANALVELQQSSLVERFALVPANPRPMAFLTANFLHGGWLHLIGNLWFLWLAGFLLEDVWGRAVYGIFYLVAGAAAMLFYIWTNPGSITPTLGASGAVAACMGAFLVRFPTLKIDMAWLFAYRLYRFKMAAYWLLPAWVLMEIFYGTLFGSMTGVAHWAHVGGFLFGAVVGLGLKFSGWEKKLDQAVNAQVSLEADPEITQASDMLGQRRYDEARQVLEQYLARKPDAIDAHALVKQAEWQAGNIPQFHAAAVKVMALHLKRRETRAAWEEFEEYVRTSGDRGAIPVLTWFELCRAGESLEQYDRVLEEYSELSTRHASTRPALEAQLAMARLYWQRLGRPNDALQFYEQVKASPLPHLDLEPAIEAGIREAKMAASGAAKASGA